tara:strand:+ start:70315 stop:71985 length:1671 start_codon:yes stop_codon:yes gene_type:complete
MNRSLLFCIAGLWLAAANATSADSPYVDPSLSSADALVNVASFADLEQLAQHRSRLEHQPRATLPEPLAALTYDEFLKITFRSERATWRDESPFYFETFHRGFVQRDQVRIFTVDQGEVSEVPYDRSDFAYGELLDPSIFPSDLGHAGLKIVGDVRGVVDDEEMLTFLGASYFRGRSVETVYGTSVRGLGLDMAMNGPEEFPCFHALWIHRPGDDEQQIEILALMDSESVSGAYRFVFVPGAVESTLDVDATIYFRRVPEKFCVAPITSMWIWGDGLRGPPKDNRPGVHDSDGLLVRTPSDRPDGGDQWSWRAFGRQDYPSVSRFRVQELKGFGVLQRNRAFLHYDDHNAQYHKRPSVWIAPRQSWKDGHIELFELPGAHEGIDNIGAYWVPDAVPSLNEPVRLNYRVSFFPGDYKEQTGVARATSFQLIRKGERTTDASEAAELTNRDIPESKEPSGDAKLRIRFAGSELQDLDVQDSVKLDVQMVRAGVVEQSVTQTSTGDILAEVDFQFTEDTPAEIAVFLERDGAALSETFKYLCPVETPTFSFPAVYTRQE